MNNHLWQNYQSQLCSYFIEITQEEKGIEIQLETEDQYDKSLKYLDQQTEGKIENVQLYYKQLQEKIQEKEKIESQMNIVKRMMDEDQKLLDRQKYQLEDVYEQLVEKIVKYKINLDDYEFKYITADLAIQLQQFQQQNK